MIYIDTILLVFVQWDVANFLPALVLEKGGYGFKFSRDLCRFRQDDAYEISSNRCLRGLSRSREGRPFLVYNHRRVCHLRSSFLISRETESRCICILMQGFYCLSVGVRFHF